MNAVNLSGDTLISDLLKDRVAVVRGGPRHLGYRHGNQPHGHLQSHHSAYAQLIEAKGSVINIASIHAFVAGPVLMAYGIARKFSCPTECSIFAQVPGPG